MSEPLKTTSSCVSAALIMLAELSCLITFGCGGGGGSTTGSQAFTATPPTTSSFAITTSSLPLGQVGIPYSFQLAASETANVTWAVQSGLMPLGLALNSTGLISGTPLFSFCGTGSSVTVTASNVSTHDVSSATLQFNIAGMSNGLTQAQIGAAYDRGIQFNCATEPVSWTLTSGTIPPGLQMHPFSSGSLQLNFQGTPTQSGPYNFSVQATDASGRVGQVSASINVLPRALALNDSTMQLGVVNQAFDHFLSPTGGTLPYTFRVNVGSLAPGLQINANTGEISGKPTSAGFYQFTIRVSDSTAPGAGPFVFDKSYNLLVTPASLPPSNDSLANATTIFPGTYTGSLSPYTDAGGNAAPDQDYYVFSGTPGETYSVGVSAMNFDLIPPSTPADPAIELLDNTGTRLNTCNDPLADNPPPGAPFTKGSISFTDACVDHDGDGFRGLSRLIVKLPPGVTQVFIHVFDFRGMARPDYYYTLGLAKQ